MTKYGRWILALTLVVVISYWKIIFTKQFLILWQWEMVSQHYAWYTYVAQYVRKGILPLWDPFRYAGNTFIGEMQTGLFYPLKVPLYFAPLDQNGLLSERAYNLYYVFSHWLIAVFTFLLVRRLGLGNLAAVVAGICFGLGGFVQWTPWPYMLDAMAWLPLVFLFLLRAFESDGSFVRLSNAAVAGLALGMTVLAGSIHFALIDAIVAVTLTAYLWSFERHKISTASAAAILVTVGTVSIVSSAVQLLPSLEYSRFAYRWFGADFPLRSLQRIPYWGLESTRFGPQSLFAFVLGEADAGKSDATTYFGVLPLILAIIGGWKYWSRPLVRYLVALALISCIYTWGSASFLHGVLYLTPYLNIAREADRFIYLTHFAMGILAAFGVQFLFEDRTADMVLHLSPVIRILKWVVIGFAVVLAATSLHLPIAVTEKTYLSFFFLAASYGLLLFLREHTGRMAQFVLLFLITWDSYSFSWTIQPRVEKQKQNDDALAQLVYDRKLADFIKAQPGMPRVHFDAEASPNIGNAYGVPVTWAMSATMLADYTDGFGYPQQRNLLSVRYTVRRKSDKSTGATPVYSDDMWNVYENPEALPRAWIVHSVEVDRSAERPLKRIVDPTFDLRRTVLVENPVEPPLDGHRVEFEDIVRWLTNEPNRLELEVTAGGPGLLVLSEVFYPGWTARVDGVPATIYRADGLLRAVPIAQGTHRVSLRYKPASVRWGVILTVLTFLGVLCLGRFRDPKRSA